MPLWKKQTVEKTNKLLAFAVLHAKAKPFGGRRPTVVTNRGNHGGMMASSDPIAHVPGPSRPPRVNCQRFPCVRGEKGIFTTGTFARFLTHQKFWVTKRAKVPGGEKFFFAAQEGGRGHERNSRDVFLSSFLCPGLLKATQKRGQGHLPRVSRAWHCEKECA